MGQTMGRWLSYETRLPRTKIVRLVAAGYKKREIAERLFISPHTVKTHARHIFDKLQVKTKVEAIYGPERRHMEFAGY
jgi:DNA-binding NarL/FixJ family response regulator